MSLWIWGHSLLFLVCWELLLWMNVGFCQLPFWHLLRDNMFFLFTQLIWWILSKDFSVIKTTLHSWDKLHLIMIYYQFYILLNFIAKILVSLFCIYIYEGYWSIHFLSWNISILFWFECNTVFMKWITLLPLQFGGGDVWLKLVLFW